MTRVRPAAVAGLFYASDPGVLRRDVQSLLAAARSAGPPPKAAIVPHAGYVYSGPIAATAYVRIAAARGRVRRVVLLGPAHHAAFRGMAAHSAEAFATPLGDVPLDRADAPGVRPLDAAHEREHCLEVQLPFLQVALGEFRIVPLLVGDAAPREVAAAIAALAGGAETIVVVSSDLSHYHDDATAKRLDRATADAITGLRPEALGRESACGRRAVAGLVAWAAGRRMRVECVDLRTSGDTAGDPSSVVGYGAFLAFDR